jgi:predicted ATPase/class 3 adenylate cyclase
VDDGLRELTVLFTDIESSTELWEHEAAAMDTALQRHDQLIATLITDHHGRVVKHTGDGSCSVFESATEALLAAGAISHAMDSEEWPTSRPLRVRIGAHRGIAVQRDRDVFGPVVNRAARIEAAAHAGQILASDAVTDGAVLPLGWSTVDLGRHRLRGVAEPLHLCQITPPGGRDGFPPIASIERRAHRWPAPLSRFVGREDELVTVADSLAAHRLVTLTGPGGVGKTRLLIEVGPAMLHRSIDDAWFADLSAVTAAAGVVEAVLAALETRPDPPATSVDALVAVLAASRALLILDNAEHVIENVADLVEELLGRVAGLRILVSSRRPLDVEGEKVIPIKPLRADGAAVELFIDRATMAGAADLDVAEVAAVCHELDGLPLAIELTARRTAMLTLPEIRAGLGDRLDLGDGSRRQARPGRGTLRATIEWSYALLDESGREAFADLAVFASAFRRPELVAFGGGNMASALDSLVTVSMVAPEPVGGVTRYRLLETLRLFAMERLRESGRLDDRRAQHRRAYLHRAAELIDDLTGPGEAVARLELALDLPNLRQAFVAAGEDGDLNTAAGVVLTLWPAIHEERGAEFAQWPDAVRAMPGLDEHPLAAGVYAAAAEAAYHRADLAAALDLAERGLLIGERIDGPPRYQAFCHGVIGQVLGWRADFSPAAERHETARRLAAEAGDRWYEGLQDAHLAFVAVRLRDRELAAAATDRAAATAAAVGQPTLRGFAHYARALFLLDEDVDEAILECREAIALGEVGGNVRGAARTRVVLVELLARKGSSPAEVLVRELECLDEVTVEAGALYVWDSLRKLIPWACQAGFDEIAVTLQAALAASPFAAQPRIIRLVEQSSRRLDPGTVEAAGRRGRALDLAAARLYARSAIEEALSVASG